MVKLLNKELEELVSYIKNSFSYKKCLLIKEKMSTNHEICSLVADVKKLQKEYVRSGYSDAIVKKELDDKEQKLKMIPIYVEYMNCLDEVNQMIDLVRDELNDYFMNVVSFNIESDQGYSNFFFLQSFYYGRIY